MDIQFAVQNEHLVLTTHLIYQNFKSKTKEPKANSQKPLINVSL